jgi:ferric-dicitrate binding protein FerR (iron transport regulator)
MATSFYSCDLALLENFVRTLGRSALIVVLSVSLIGIPAMATPANPASAPLGWVLQAERAHVGADITAGGATIYDGDRLETQGDGTLRARLGNSQLYLRQSTIAEVHGLSNGFSASLLSGTVIASAPEGQTFQVLADGATIRPVGTRATVAQITRVSFNELLLTSNVGAIQVSLDGGDVKTIEAGNSFRMEIQPEPPSPRQDNGSGTQTTGRNRAIYLWIAIAGAATGVGIWRAMESPDR